MEGDPCHRCTHVKVTFKRDIQICKEIYNFEKRYTNVRRDKEMWKETHAIDVHTWKMTFEKTTHAWKKTYKCEKRYTNEKRDIHMWEETYKCQKWPVREMKNVNSDLSKKRTIRETCKTQKKMWKTRDLWIWKKTYKRDLCTCTGTRELLQTCFVGPLVLWKETYTRDKFAWKETCKRDIHVWVEAYEIAL